MYFRWILRSVIFLLGISFLIDGLQFPYALGSLILDEHRVGELAGFRCFPEAETFTLEISRKSPGIGSCHLTYTWSTLWEVIASVMLGSLLICSAFVEWKRPIGLHPTIEAVKA